MVSDCKDNIISIINQSNEDPNTIINALCEDKIKLLKDKKSLLHLLAEKDEQLIKLSEIYQKKWENVCNYLKSIEEMCIELNICDNRIVELKHDNHLVLDSPMESSFSNSSFFTVTETGDSNFTTSSESLVAANETIKRELNPKESYFSLNSLSNYNDFDKSDEGSCDHLYQNYVTSNRPASHCLQNNNKSSNSNPGIDTATSEPQFIVPQVSSPKTKRPVKRSSILKSEKNSPKQVEKSSNLDKNLSKFTDKEFLSWLVSVVRLPKLLVEDLTFKNKIDGICLDQITEPKLSKIFGTSDKLIRKKIMLALEENRSSGHNRENIPDSDLSRKDHMWVANVWLKKHLGLGHLSHAFLSRCVDGRLLKFIATSPRQKEFIHMATTNYDHSSGLTILPMNFNKNISEPTKTDLRSIKFGLELMAKFNFDLEELDRRRGACESINHDVLVWTNERVSKWFHKINLKNYIRGIEYSGIHGGLMVLDPQFSMVTMSKLLQIPSEVVKKNNLDDKFSSLLKPSRFNEGVKNRRSTSIFRRRSFSQPRHSKSQNNRNTNNKTPTINLELSDNASMNDNGQTLTLKASHKEKSQTFDLSSSTNSNFVRKYRKPNDDTQTRQNPEAKSESQNLILPSYVVKSSVPKSSVHSAQISRKAKTKSVSESENSEEL